MSFNLRLATLDDVSVLEELIPISARELQRAYYTEEQIEGAIGTVFGVDTQLIRDETYFVCEEAGRVVGCGGWSRRKSLYGSDKLSRKENALLDPKRDPARIRAFFVHPDRARRGIGRKIMCACEAAAQAMAFRKLEIVATLAGEPLYARFGYTVHERFELALPNAQFLPVVRMARSTSVP